MSMVQKKQATELRASYQLQQQWESYVAKVMNLITVWLSFY